MNKESGLLKKTIVILISILFFGSGISSTIAGENNDGQDISSITFYTFGKSGTKVHKVDLPTVVVEDISIRFEDLKHRISVDPDGVETKVLKSDFVDLLYSYGLIPRGLSRDDVVSLLDPWWLKHVEGGSPFTRLDSVGSSVGSGVLPGPLGYRGSAFFCGVAGYGAGVMFLPVMAPRPRLAAFWSSLIYAGSYATNLYTGHGFIAYGAQFGSALGFMGIGLSFVYPGVPALFSFYGYALFARVTAEEVETYPPNSKPVISGENPSSGSWDVPLSLSELSFSISDADFDRMSYSVTTSPDIGSGQGYNKGGGVYSVPVSGLEYDKSYSWTVSVSDGSVTVERSFSFVTVGGPPFDPFDEGWKYRKKITINHSQVDDDLSDFPVLVSLVDSDLAVKAQEDGDDILFMDGSGIANKVFHEIELFDGSSGELVAWVNVPSLSSSVDTVLYLYYGNSDCSSQEFPARVWNPNYIHVWHLGENLGDSTGFDDGVNHGTKMVPGMIGFARDFEQSEGDYINLGDMLQPADGSLTTMTWEAWVKPEVTDFIIMSKYDTSGTDYSSYHVTFEFNGKFHLAANSGFGTSKSTQGHTDEPYSVLNQWIFLTGTFKLGGTNDLDAFINGEEVPFSQSYNHANIMCDTHVTDNLGRVRTENNIRFADAVIDEVRWSKIVRSDAWIKTSYNTMNDPLSFFSVGPEESGP